MPFSPAESNHLIHRISHSRDDPPVSPVSGDQGINLAQGFPDFSAPAVIKAAACAAINDDINQYSITWGAADFRRAIASSSIASMPSKQIPKQR